jgi:DNA-binding LacI/PurR family transcriptional regulator
MIAEDVTPSKICWLAKRMEEDIRTRGLRDGEPYFTTAQAGRALGISKSTAYRAMKILADRQVLVSHLGRGTFVGPGAVGGDIGKVKCVHVLVTRDLFQSSAQSTHGWLAGMSAALPDYAIQFNFISLRDAEADAKRLLDQAAAAGTLSAVVVAGCPREVQELVLLRGVPALVLGSDYSSTRQLASIDADQFENGRLATEYLLKHGCRRIALLMRESWFPGDRRLFEGVGRALDDARLGHEALMLRNLSLDPAVLAVELQRLLRQEPRPEGCICRTPLFAAAVMQQARAAKLAMPADLELIVAGLDRQSVAGLGLPSVAMKVDVAEQVAIGGRMLRQVILGEQPDPLHVIMPVELVEPNRRGSRPAKAAARRRVASRRPK